MALKINNVWKKWGVRIWSPFKATYIASCRKRKFEEAVELGYREVGKLKAEMGPRPKRWSLEYGPPDLVDVGPVTVDIVMDLKGTVLVERGIRLTQTSPEGVRMAFHVSRGSQTFASLVRIKRGGEAYVSLDPYLFEMTGEARTHYSRLTEAFSEAAEYLKEHSVFWNAFRHTA